jgi:hypothetical protein
MLMEQSGDNRGSITKERFVKLQPIGEFMLDAVEQSKFLGDARRGIEKARQIQQIRRSGQTPEKPKSMETKINELGSIMKSGKLGAVAAKSAATTDWIESEKEKTRQMHKANRERAEQEAKNKASEEQEKPKEESFVPQHRRMTFHHGADGSVEIVKGG